MLFCCNELQNLIMEARIMILKFKKFIKRPITLVLAMLFAVSAITAMSVSAASEKVNHTVNLSSTKGSNSSYWITMKRKGTCSDTFDNYPVIYDDYRNSYNRSRAFLKGSDKKTKYKSFILQRNSSAPTTVSYGTLSKGDWRLFYQHVKGGGFKDNVLTIKRY